MYISECAYGCVYIHVSVRMDVCMSVCACGTSIQQSVLCYSTAIDGYPDTTVNNIIAALIHSGDTMHRSTIEAVYGTDKRTHMYSHWDYDT